MPAGRRKGVQIGQHQTALLNAVWAAAKDGARARASELFRGGAVHWPLVKHDGRVEAALIALWGIRALNATAA
jgi:hypothetical protein